jgi:hypothetical protein
MKLTKGKISKLYNIKKQTIKRVRKPKISNKRRTFRNKKNFNLARKTIKNFNYNKYKGGNNENNIPKEENIISNINPIMNTHIKQEPEVVEEEPTLIEEPEVVEEPALIEEEPEVVEEPALIEEEPEVVEEPTLIEEEPEVVEKPTLIEEEPEVVEEPNELVSEDVPSKQELIESLTNVVDYITDSVAEKVSQNVTSEQYEDTPQDGFDTINKTINVMASSGGSRFKRTKRFRLVNRNKTRYHKSL